MKKVLSVLLLGFFLVSLMASPLYCQKAEKILEKMIDALGGRKVLESIKDTTYTGTYELPQMGMSDSFTMYIKEPSKMRLDIEAMGMMITRAFDGETAWMTNPQTGANEEMPEQFVPYIKRQALGFESFLNPEKYGITYTYKGKEKIEEKDCLIMEQTYADGYKATLFVDSKTFLPHKTKGIGLNDQGLEVDTEEVTFDYKKVNGLMVAFSGVTYQQGQEYLKIAITEVTINKGLADSFFEMGK